MTACDASSFSTTGKPLKQAGATTPPSDALPHFSDWRAAYLGDDGRIHAVSLDGKTDVAGPALPDLTMYDLVVTSEGISPDGHMIAYDAGGGIDIVNLTSGHDSAIQAFPYGLFWAPDSSQLAVDQGSGSIAIVNSQTGSIHPIQGTPAHVVGNVLGWIDKTHLAITDTQDLGLVTLPNGNQYNTVVSLASLDIATGQVRVIARISNPQLACQGTTLSPDGKFVLFSNGECQGLPFTPLVDEIDMATGVVTPLPGIAQATHADFSSVAWQPNTDRIAVTSTAIGVNGGLQNWLLTLGQDRAQQLPGAHDVAGWAPGTNTLVLTTGYQIGIGSGPFTLYAFDVSANGQAQPTPMTSLTGAAMTFPFLGFVRN